jgi:hypothetical protein
MGWTWLHACLVHRIKLSLLWRLADRNGKRTAPRFLSGLPASIASFDSRRRPHATAVAISLGTHRATNIAMVAESDSWNERRGDLKAAAPRPQPP